MLYNVLTSLILQHVRTVCLLNAFEGTMIIFPNKIREKCRAILSELIHKHTSSSNLLDLSSIDLAVPQQTRDTDAQGFLGNGVFWCNGILQQYLWKFPLCLSLQDVLLEVSHVNLIWLLLRRSLCNRASKLICVIGVWLWSHMHIVSLSKSQIAHLALKVLQPELEICIVFHISYVYNYVIEWT